MGTKDRVEISKAVFDSKQPKFVNSGLADSYMSYGIEERTCSGRNFARREIVAFCALIVHYFDVELHVTNKGFEETSTFYEIGTQRLRNKISFRIRKRAFR